MCIAPGELNRPCSAGGVIVPRRGTWQVLSSRTNQPLGTSLRAREAGGERSEHYSVTLREVGLERFKMGPNRDLYIRLNLSFKVEKHISKRAEARSPNQTQATPNSPPPHPPCKVKARWASLQPPSKHQPDKILVNPPLCCYLAEIFSNNKQQHPFALPQHRGNRELLAVPGQRDHTKAEVPATTDPVQDNLNHMGACARRSS